MAVSAIKAIHFRSSVALVASLLSLGAMAADLTASTQLAQSAAGITSSTSTGTFTFSLNGAGSSAPGSGPAFSPATGASSTAGASSASGVAGAAGSTGTTGISDLDITGSSIGASSISGTPGNGTGASSVSGTSGSIGASSITGTVSSPTFTGMPDNLFR